MKTKKKHYEGTSKFLNNRTGFYSYITNSNLEILKIHMNDPIRQDILRVTLKASPHYLAKINIRDMT